MYVSAFRARVSWIGLELLFHDSLGKKSKQKGVAGHDIPPWGQSLIEVEFYEDTFEDVLQPLYYKTGSFKYIAMYLNDQYA